MDGVGSQGITREETNGVSQVDGDADMAHTWACTLGLGEGSTKKQWFLPAPPSERKLPLLLFL